METSVYRFAWVLDDFDDLIGLILQAVPLLHVGIWIVSGCVFAFAIVNTGLSGALFSAVGAGLILALLLQLRPGCTE